MVGLELTERSYAAACRNPLVTPTTRVEEAISGNLGVENPVDAVVPTRIVHVACSLAKAQGSPQAIRAMPDSGTVAAAQKPTTGGAKPPSWFGNMPRTRVDRRADVGFSLRVQRR